jgi:succinate dehydrogenase / fumarate reductase, cytochrome b subunit
MATPTPAQADEIDPQERAAAPIRPERVRRGLWLTEIYRSALGKKYAMALSGIVLLVYVFLHMVGNFKIYMGADELNTYAHWLRELGYPALPYSALLWILRIGLLAAFVIHVHAAYALTVTNRRARPQVYESEREYVAANFAARTMRWTGIIVLLFVIFHLMDLTWGNANPEFVRGEVYDNVVASFSRWPVALFYVVANLALALHIYHGAWSLFQTMGWNKPRFNLWRKYFAVGLAVVIGVGNISFPIAVLTGIVS